MSDDINVSLGTTEVIWKLADLYSGYDDGKIEECIRQSEQDAAAINKQYSTRVGELSAEELFELVKRLEKLEVKLGQLFTFAFLNFATSTHDQEVSAFLQRMREIASNIGKETVFFELEWNKVDQEKAAALVESETLVHYHHYLENMRKYAPHQLSQIEL